MQIVVALAFITLVSQCTNNSVLFALEELTQPPLSWEENHPERASWSRELRKQIVIHFDDLSSAKDMPYFCPTFHYLNNSQKILALSEMMVWTAYYESSWNPNSASVDVGPQSTGSNRTIARSIPLRKLTQQRRPRRDGEQNFRPSR